MNMNEQTEAEVSFVCYVLVPVVGVCSLRGEIGWLLGLVHDV